MVNILSKDDLLYLAGIFDGEGHFSFSRSVHKGNGGAIYVYYYPAMGLMNPDIEYLKVIQRMIGGGGISARGKSRTYVHQLFSDKAVAVAKQISPFMRREYQRLRAGLIMQYERGDYTKNESLYLAMRHLTNQMGGGTLFVEHERYLGHNSHG